MNLNIQWMKHTLLLVFSLSTLSFAHANLAQSNPIQGLSPEQTAITGLSLDIEKKSPGLIELSEEQLSNTTGQALISLTYIAPTDAMNLETQRANGDKNIGFYKLGLEAEVSLNTNIKKLQLGCGGENKSGGCDLDIDNMSFGCLTGAKGNCITLETTVANQPKGLDSDNSLSNQKALKDFVLNNPFLQFAIRNPDKASTREVVGFRLGADQAIGPLSIGNLNSFSGYLTGTANLSMNGETNVSPVSTNNWSKSLDQPSAFLGLQDDYVLNLLIASVKYSELTADYSTVQRNNLGVIVSGNRQTQAFINGLDLSGVVDEIMNTMIVNQSCVRVLGLCTGDIGTALANGLMPALKSGVGNYIKQQLATGLGTTTNGLSSYLMPYNLSNVHQIDVDSNVFGIALTQQALQFPGYAQAVQQGWSMYLQDAYTLNISDKVSNLVKNIASAPYAARNGDVTLLAPAYRNCYGNLKFC